MATLRIDQASTFDVVIDGWGYMLAEDDPSPFQLQCQDDALEKTSIDVNLEQNKLDTLYWGINRSWHEGQGQTRLDVPPRFQIDPSTASSPYKHLRSKGVDITTRGQLTLLRKTGRYMTLTNQDPIPAKLVATDSYVYMATGINVVQRFSSVDTGDAIGIATGSATQAVADLDTDGTVVYAAVATDGITRAPGPTNTQINAMDATTGWAGSGGTIALSTTNKKEGTGSIGLTVAASGTGTATLTFGSAQNYSAIDQFSIWLYTTYVPPTGQTNLLRLTMTTSGGNYFYRDVNAATGIWVQDISARTNGWTTVGSPNWNSIASFSIAFTNLSASSAVLSFDDLRSVTTQAFAAWGTWDARVVRWANDQLFAAGIKSGTQWRFYKATAGTGGSEIYVLPDGWVVSDIASLNGLVYVSAYRGGKGVIYTYDGTNPTLQVACPTDALGNGTIPLCLIPFAGAGMLIGCRRLTSTASAGLGVLYRSFPDAIGALRIERLAILGTDDGRDYGIRCGVSFGDYAYFGWNYGDEPPGENFLVSQVKRSGLGVYWPETGAWGRSTLSDVNFGNVSGIVEDVVIFKGLKMFTVGANGLHIELPDNSVSNYIFREAEGGVVSSLIDINVSADKLWLAQESYYANPANQASPVSHAYSLDGLTWLNDTGAANAATVRLRTSFATLGLKTPSIWARTRLTTPNTLASPILYTTGIGGYPATKPLPVHALMIRAYPSSERLDISRTHQRHDGWTTLSRLITLWQNQTIVDYQPPWAFSDTTPGGISYKVRVAQVQATKGWNASGDAQGGLIACQLKVVP